MLELGSGTILCADNNLPVIGPFFIIALVQIISGCRIVSAFSKPEDRDISFIYFFASVYFSSGCRVVYVPLMNWIIYKVLDCCCFFGGSDVTVSAELRLLVRNYSNGRQLLI